MSKAHWVRMIGVLLVFTLTVMLADALRGDAPRSGWLFFLLLADVGAAFGCGVLTVAIHFYEHGITLGPDRNAPIDRRHPSLHLVQEKDGQVIHLDKRRGPNAG